MGAGVGAGEGAGVGPGEGTAVVGAGVGASVCETSKSTYVHWQKSVIFSRQSPFVGCTVGSGVGRGIVGPSATLAPNPSSAARRRLPRVGAVGTGRRALVGGSRVESRRRVIDVGSAVGTRVGTPVGLCVQSLWTYS